MNEPTGKNPTEEDFVFSGATGAFATTLWSAVLDAKDANSPSASQALETLCRAYWYPLYAFIRRRGYGPSDAEDLTQAFFAHLFEKGALKTVGREKGRFRSFLLAALTHFLNNEYQKSQAWKRGGKNLLESWDALRAEDRYRHEPVDNVTPERLFERRWAFTLLERVLSQLRQEYQAGGKLAVFDELQPLLAGEAGAGGTASAATRLGMHEGAAKVALHRLRRRFGDNLRTHIACTVASPDQVEDEIRYLFSVVALSPPL